MSAMYDYRMKQDNAEIDRKFNEAHEIKYLGQTIIYTKSHGRRFYTIKNAENIMYTNGIKPCIGDFDSIRLAKEAIRRCRDLKII